MLMFFLLGIMACFPQEAMLNYFVDMAARKSAIQIYWEEGSFSALKTTLSNVQLSTPEKKISSFSTMNIRPSFLGFSLAFKEGEMAGVLRTMLDRIHFKIDNIAVSSYLPPGKLTLDGVYAARSGNGNGKFSMLFSGALFPMSSARDVSAEGPFTVSAKEMSVDFDIQGKGTSGKGSAKITWQKEFRNSPISGNIEIKEGGKSIKISIAGTVGAPQMAPVMQ
ncbi:MAG: hypothetical protein V2A78_02300 [bacterium]